MKSKFPLILLGILIVWSNRNAPIFSFDLSEILICVVMGILSIRPALGWLTSGMKGIPGFEAYCALHFFYYVSPYIRGSVDFLRYPLATRVQTGLAVCLFLFFAQLAFGYAMKNLVGSVVTRGRFFNRSISALRHMEILWALLGIWWILTAAITLQVLPNVGAAFNVLRSFQASSGAIAVFYLFGAHGKKILSSGKLAILLIAVVSGILLMFTSGFLVTGTFIILIAILGFTMEAHRFPILSAVLCLAFISFLHLGKSEVRERYWQEGTNFSERGVDPIELYSFWAASSSRHFFDKKHESEERASFLQRASLIQMLSLVVDESPGRRPFLGGETYLQIPKLLVPRLFWPNKPRGSLPTETLGIYYGIQTLESVEITAIGLGAIAEAWANFGWLGVVLVGVFLGFVFAVPGTLSRRLETDKLGYVLAVVFLSYSLDLENALGTFVVSAFQTLFVASVGFYFISKNEALPTIKKVTRKIMMNGPSKGRNPSSATDLNRALP
ncbi:MAG: hypothetical protein JWL59_554 [Chthoniobacteraceae bacterium]|nr:hypothetical protein [Chthoniobacteraceae bacterium]